MSTNKIKTVAGAFDWFEKNAARVPDEENDDAKGGPPRHPQGGERRDASRETLPLPAPTAAVSRR